MTTSSVSFRISRHAEDLAQTIHALSQRVIQLEQRLASVEAHLSSPEEEPELSTEQQASFSRVEQLLQDCRELLAVDPLAVDPLPVGEHPGMAASSQDATFSLHREPELAEESEAELDAAA